jgi:hypothetical protein
MTMPNYALPGLMPTESPIQDSIKNGPVYVQLEEHYHGDPWQGIPTVGPILIDDFQPATPLTRVRFEFRKEGVLLFTVDSAPDEGDAPAVIVNPTTWEASVPPVKESPLTPGLWSWDAEYYCTDFADKRTLHYGDLIVTGDGSPHC